MTTAVDHLLELIRLPSVSSLSNRQVIEYAENVLHAKGWGTRRLMYKDSSGEEKINLIAAPPNQNVADRDVDLALFCHTDTVPFSIDWTNALDPFVEGEKLRGCGACDVKGFMACLLAAADQIEPELFVDGLRIVLTADEEIGCIGASHLIAADAVRPKRIVIGEPTSLHVARAGKGYCLAKVTVVGKEAHSAHPNMGASAIFAAARVISAIEEFSEELAKERHNFFEPGFTTINVGPIPGQSADKVLNGVCEITEKLRLVDPRFVYRVTTLRTQGGFETPENSQLVRAIEEFTGQPAVSIPFGSEASLLSAIAEEVVVIGPGDMRSAHSSREFVPIPELDFAVRLVKKLMCRG